MKTPIIFITLLFTSFIVKAQEVDKDTLYFSIDNHYTISPTIIPNLASKTFWEKVDYEKQLIKQTKTNGYVFFIGNGLLTKGLKPKKILSIKEYIENRKFYLDGKYNKIIDTGKLKDSLTDKYKIFFVNNDEFISPRELTYYSYYPIREGDNLIENKIKDTLFFQLDTDYFRQHVEMPKQYYIGDGSPGSDGSFFFNEISFVNNLNAKEVLSLKYFIQSSRFYDKNKKQKLDDLKLFDYFKNYVIFLVSGNNKKAKYIKVEPGFEIE